MLSAAIPVRVIAEEERRQENTLEQVDAGAVGNSVDSVTSDIDTSESAISPSKMNRNS